MAHLQDDPLARIIPEDNLGWVLEESARRHGPRTFLRFPESAYTFEETERESSRFANMLVGLGVNHGDRVAVMLENCPEYVFAWFGANKLGAVEVSVNTAFKGLSLRYIMEQSGAVAIVVGSEFLPAVMAEADALPGLKSIIVVGDTPAGSDARVMKWSDVRACAPDFVSRASPLDVSMLGYTSGTTGPSKGAMVPHNRIVKTGREMAILRSIRPDDNLFTCLPLFHGNAKYHTVLPALVSGCQATLTGRFSASRFWDDVRRYDATQFNYLGVMISILLKADPSPKDREHRARMAFGAGAQNGLLEQFEARFGVHLMEAYGLTEGGIALANRPYDRRAGSCGKPMPGYEVEVVDDWDNPVPAGKEGELVLRSRRPYTTMIGYHNMPAESAEAYRNFWLHTGDLARKDEDGFFFFVDRKKDAIRRRGENISTFEIEAVINAHPAVAESAAFAVRADVGEDDVMATVVLREGATLAAEQLVEFCSTRMPYFWVPRYLQIGPEPLPRTATNKVEKYKLRQAGVLATTFDRDATKTPRAKQRETAA